MAFGQARGAALPPSLSEKTMPKYSSRLPMTWVHSLALFFLLLALVISGSNRPSNSSVFEIFLARLCKPWHGGESPHVGGLENGEKLVRPLNVDVMDDIRTIMHESCDNGDSQKSGTTVSLTDYVDHLVNSYNSILEEVVRYQTMSWNIALGYKQIDPVALQSWKSVNKKKNASIPRPEVRKNDTITSADFFWDEDDDIPSYFEKLKDGCGLNALEYPEEFERDCLDFLNDLVYKPRCTTRCDMRQTCKRDMKEDISNDDAVLDLLTTRDGHFSDESLNIVIVGAGPAGLFLANALAEVNRLRRANRTESHLPPISITVIENRVQSAGFKLPYTRKWETQIFLDDVDGMIDHRIIEIFGLFSSGDCFAAPLNAIETLLLLSNREHGVKYVFDANYEQYVAILQENVKNLLFFDASGHRLDDVDFGVTDLSNRETAKKWDPQPDDWEWGWFGEDQYEAMKKHDHIVGIFQHQDMIFPVAPNGEPLTSFWLDLNDLPVFEDTYEGLEEFWSTYGNSTRLCQRCSSGKTRGEKCWTFCTQNLYVDNVHNLRDDIQGFMERLEEQGEQRTLWFSTMRGATMNLLLEQASEFSQILNDHGYGNDPNGMPLSQFPLSKVTENTILQQNGVAQAFERIAKVAREDQPLISVFPQRPYIYKNALVKDSQLFAQNSSVVDSKSHTSLSPPMLRIGDSLLSGDSNIGSGLWTHIWMIQRFTCPLRGLDADC